MFFFSPGNTFGFSGKMAGIKLIGSENVQHPGTLRTLEKE